ncbi:GHKL domain-containing protein [Listeria innocua]|uniref:sensor histidine kinase n=1 Tax=Listeria innocua TaxID=1642 RepID=UPI0016238A9E|nr:GHKL domain-containing protein [Listeria innocua]MBC1904672.1 GHKL domain-containing protein [Listeria innocua]MBC2137416.1 GHKL domain-containing protein [Listeria innocua]
MLIELLIFLVHTGQAIAYSIIYQSISKNKLSYLEFFSFLVLFDAVTFLLNYFGTILIFLFLYLHSYRKNKQENKNLLWFYSIYTVLVTSLLGYVFLNAATFLLGLKNEINFSILLINLIAPIFPILVNHYLLKLLKPNVDFLRKNSDLINTVFFSTINTILSMCSIILFSNFWFEKYIGINPLRNYLTLIFVATIVALLSYLSVKTRELNNLQLQRLKDEQITDLTNYVEHIEVLYNDIRSFRHDYHNMLISLKESIKTQNVNTIEETYESILANEKITLQDNTYHLTKLNNLKILPIKGIISAKTIKALQENIHVSLEITDPITNTSIDILDYVRILSILLDNAIEAAASTSDPSISIVFLVDQEKEEHKIIIENSCLDKQMNLSKIYESGHSTKGANRGIGLSTLKNIFKRYNFLSLETECTNYVFRQLITIKGEKER